MNSKTLAETIKNNYEKVIHSFEVAARKADKKPDDIKLIAVSKRQPIEKIHAYIQAGGKILGENYPEEGAEKKAILKAEKIEWHMIGHIQSRKSQIAAESYDWIQTIDSIRIAEKLNNALSVLGKSLPVLIEINIAFENTKSGFLYMPEKNDAFWMSLEAIQSQKNLQLRGIMVMPPLMTLPEESRKYFRQARLILDMINKHYPELILRELSMGTSQDYMLAIEEGATMVRVGTAIFGNRI